MSVSFCVLCAFYYPDAERHLPDRTQTCETGRRKLERDRLTVRSMYLRLAEPEPTVWATRWVDRDGRLSLVQDEVADALPAAPVPARSRAPQVTGSRERQLPIDVDQVDLTGRCATPCTKPRPGRRSCGACRASAAGRCPR
jgi:hypothetical protein